MSQCQYMCLSTVQYGHHHAFTTTTVTLSSSANALLMPLRPPCHSPKPRLPPHCQTIISSVPQLLSAPSPPRHPSMTPQPIPSALWRVISVKNSTHARSMRSAYFTERSVYFTRRSVRFTIRGRSTLLGGRSTRVSTLLE